MSWDFRFYFCSNYEVVRVCSSEGSHDQKLLQYRLLTMKWSMVFLVLPSGHIHVFLWISLWEKWVFDTIIFLEVAKCASVHPSSLHSLCRLCWPIVKLKHFIHPALFLCHCVQQHSHGVRSSHLHFNLLLEHVRLLRYNWLNFL